MAKKIFVFLTFAVIITLVAMALTKPEPWEHYGAVRSLAMRVVDQEVSSVQLAVPLPEEYAKMATEMGSEIIMGAAGNYLQTNMQVEDYLVVSVGMLNYHGQTLPVTVGTFGKVFVLVDEDDIRRAIK